MGQVITSADMRSVIDANLRGYIKQTTTSYARLFGRSPTFVTYLTHDPISSMVDVNLGGAIQIVGPESPLKYHLIDDFPLYGLTEADVSSAYEENQGIVQNGVRGEAYVLPGTLEPSENDLFVIDYLESKLVFRVISCAPDRVEGKAFFKVEYVLERYDWRQLQRQITKNYNFELSTIGTGGNPIIEQDTAILLREMDAIVEVHASMYWENFYDRNSGTVMLRSGFGNAVHDRSLSMFLQRNNVLGGGGFLKSRSVRPPQYADRGQFDAGVYTRTLYWRAERGGYSDGDVPLNGLTFACAVPHSPSSPFYSEFAISGYLEAMPSPSGEYVIGGAEFIPKLTAADFVTSNPIHTLALQSLHKSGFSMENMADSLRLFNTMLNDEHLLDLREDQFWLMPIILLRAKRFAEDCRRVDK